MTYLCLALLLVLAGIFYLVNRNTGVQASDDPLSVGMVERWNGALPAGFSRESAEHMADCRGDIFAKLT